MGRENTKQSDGYNGLGRFGVIKIDRFACLMDLQDLQDWLDGIPALYTTFSFVGVLRLGLPEGSACLFGVYAGECCTLVEIGVAGKDT